MAATGKEVKFVNPSLFIQRFLGLWASDGKRAMQEAASAQLVNSWRAGSEEITVWDKRKWSLVEEEWRNAGVLEQYGKGT